MNPAKSPRPPHRNDRPRWRCKRCGLTVFAAGLPCAFCQDGRVSKPAPTLAVERAEQAVVRAVGVWADPNYDSHSNGVLTLAWKKLMSARARARLARRRTK